MRSTRHLNRVATLLVKQNSLTFPWRITNSLWGHCFFPEFPDFSLTFLLIDDFPLHISEFPDILKNILSLTFPWRVATLPNARRPIARKMVTNYLLNRQNHSIFMRLIADCIIYLLLNLDPLFSLVKKSMGDQLRPDTVHSDCMILAAIGATGDTVGTRHNIAFFCTTVLSRDNVVDKLFKSCYEKRQTFDKQQFDMVNFNITQLSAPKPSPF